MSEIKVCHLTSAHPQEDIRIFHKECVSLANAGYETYQISCGDTYDKFGVHLIGVGEQEKKRRDRMLKSSKRVYKAAVELNADVYHFHDPELLRYGLKLKKAGKKVIFDSHEDVAAQIVDKKWIPKPFRKLVSAFYKSYETRIVKRLDAVVAATPHIAETFKGRCRKAVVVNNYPKLDDIVFQEKPFSEREMVIAYAGGIDEIRGEKVMIEAMKDADAQLIVAGNHEVKEAGGVKFIGKISRKEVNELYGRARAGIVIYQPAANHIESQPIKMFEFMAAGLPVVASDFPLWKGIVEGNQCGISVDPRDPEAVRSACMELLNDPERGQELGRNGKKAVDAKYNWNNEERQLLELYSQL